MKKALLVCLGLSLGVALHAQTSGDEEKGGKPILLGFCNFHTGFGKQNDDRGFELDRIYIGYQYNLGKGLSIKGVLDAGAETEDYDNIAYVKNAEVDWKRGKWSLSGGLISTTQFNMVEKFWGYRYMYMSFQDKYKFGSSADLGISAAYQAAKWVSVDAIISNGEGYKKVQFKDGLLYGVGATLTPVKGLSLRVYGSMNEQPDGKNTWNLATFAGYQTERFRVGAEYNWMTNYKGVENQDKSGVSVYGAVNANKWLNVFARYDNLWSKDDWAISDDEGVFLVGAEFKIWKYIKLAPNFRMNMPKEDGADNEYSAYISCYFGI